MGNQSSSAIESAMELFQNYDMLNHLNDRDKAYIISALKDIARSGFRDAKSILWNADLDIKL
jgi:DNA-binding phage protein